MKNYKYAFRWLSISWYINTVQLKESVNIGVRLTFISKSVQQIISSSVHHQFISSSSVHQFIINSFVRQSVHHFISSSVNHQFISSSVHQFTSSLVHQLIITSPNHQLIISSSSVHHQLHSTSSVHQLISSSSGRQFIISSTVHQFLSSSWVHQFISSSVHQFISSSVHQFISPKMSQNCLENCPIIANNSAVAASTNSAVCKKTFRDFPNSLDNSVICNKVKSEGKKFDWLRKNRALCDESQDFVDHFMSKSCAALWCDYAAPQLADWSAEANSSGVGGCQGVEGRVESVQTKKRRCKTVENKLNAADFLQCRNWI